MHDLSTHLSVWTMVIVIVVHVTRPGFAVVLDAVTRLVVVLSANRTANYCRIQRSTPGR